MSVPFRFSRPRRSTNEPPLSILRSTCPNKRDAHSTLALHANTFTERNAVRHHWLHQRRHIHMSFSELKRRTREELRAVRSRTSAVPKSVSSTTAPISATVDQSELMASLRSTTILCNIPTVWTLVALLCLKTAFGEQISFASELGATGSQKPSHTHLPSERDNCGIPRRERPDGGWRHRVTCSTTPIPPEAQPHLEKHKTHVLSQHVTTRLHVLPHRTAFLAQFFQQLSHVPARSSRNASLSTAYSLLIRKKTPRPHTHGDLKLFLCAQKPGCRTSCRLTNTTSFVVTRLVGQHHFIHEQFTRPCPIKLLYVPPNSSLLFFSVGSV